MSPTPTLPEKKVKHKEVMEHFDNINDITEFNFYLDMNFYNTTLILVIILIAINIPRLKSKF